MSLDLATSAIMIQYRISELAQLTPIEYALRRKEKAKAFGMTVAALDLEVDRMRPKRDVPGRGKVGAAVLFPEVERWPDPVDGALLLNAISKTVQRFVILPPGAAEVFALWIVHTFAFAAAEATPYLAITSPEKRSGKSRMLELAQVLAQKPLATSSITAAAIFRTIDAFGPALLLDEAETYIKNSEEIRGVLDSGHRKASANTVRLVGEEYTPTNFSTWSPKMLACIGRLPDTIEDRCIMIPMRRKTSDEMVEDFRYERVFKECDPLRRKAAGWAADHLEALRESDGPRLSKVNSDQPSTGEDPLR